MFGSIRNEYDDTEINNVRILQENFKLLYHRCNEVPDTESQFVKDLDAKGLSVDPSLVPEYLKNKAIGLLKDTYSSRYRMELEKEGRESSLVSEEKKGRYRYG